MSFVEHGGLGDEAKRQGGIGDVVSFYHDHEIFVTAGECELCTCKLGESLGVRVK